MGIAKITHYWVATVVGNKHNSQYENYFYYPLCEVQDPLDGKYVFPKSDSQSHNGKFCTSKPTM